MSARLRKFVLTLLQILALSLLWWLANEVSRRYLPFVPGSVLGMAALLALLGSGLLKPHWLALGTAWLLGEMLLLFIPAVIAVVDYGAFVRAHGLALMALIMLSTLTTMVATALAVEWASRYLRAHGQKP